MAFPSCSFVGLWIPRERFLIVVSHELEEIYVGGGERSKEGTQR